MNSIDIDPISFLWFVPFLFIVLGLNHHYELKLNRSIIIGLVRMTVQLLLVGVFLLYVFDLDNPYINLSYLLVMFLIGTGSVYSKLDYKLSLYPIIFIVFVLVTLPMLFLFNGLILKVESVFQAPYMIPITGMLLGNALRGLVLSTNHFVGQITGEYKKYQYYLMVFNDKHKALRPFMRATMTLSMKPSISTLETMGLITLPGMMTGLILGGTSPLVAVKYQIAIMVAIFLVNYLSNYLIIQFISFRSFDSLDRFKYKNV